MNTRSNPDPGGLDWQMGRLRAAGLHLRGMPHDETMCSWRHRGEKTMRQSSLVKRSAARRRWREGPADMGEAASMRRFESAGDFFDVWRPPPPGGLGR